MEIAYAMVAGSNTFFYDSSDEEIDNKKISKIKDYYESIIPTYNDDTFFKHFRLKKTTFESLLLKVGQTTVGTFVHKGNQEIALGKQLLITIWYLANLECFRSVADRFGVSKSCCWSVVYRICYKLLDVNSKFKIISWPTAEKAVENIENFKKKSKFPGTVGAVDGTHIAIKAPHNNHTSYINRKGYHSILLQVVCDSKFMFIDCYCGEVGSIHDSVLFRRSGVNEKLQNLEYPTDWHIIGDRAYKLSNRLLVGFKDTGRLTRKQKNFNYLLSKARVAVEQSIALLKGKFRRLKLLETTKTEMVPLLIMSACILHNFCISEGDMPIDINIRREIEEERRMAINNEPNIGVPHNTAVVKRNNIVNSLPLVI